MTRPSGAVQLEVIRRASGRCEYCRFPEAAAELPFHIDHILAEKHGGLTTLDNLAWSCFSCNLRKGPNIAGIDPSSGELTRLYHPRTDNWNEHFEWVGFMLLGKTAVGRTTVQVLDINASDAVDVREALYDEGLQE